MIRKSGNRFSDKITFKQIDNATRLACALTAISTTAGLAFDQPFGEMNHRLFRSTIVQFVKSPQQPQFEQRLQQTETLRR
jgi:hypothetical protein